MYFCLATATAFCAFAFHCEYLLYLPLLVFIVGQDIFHMTSMIHSVKLDIMWFVYILQAPYHIHSQHVMLYWLDSQDNVLRQHCISTSVTGKIIHPLSTWYCILKIINITMHCKYTLPYTQANKVCDILERQLNKEIKISQ